MARANVSPITGSNTDEIRAAVSGALTAAVNAQTTEGQP
jgi:hypothetical protein